MADGITQECRIRVFRVLPPVHPDQPPYMRAAFENEQDAVCHLIDLCRIGRIHHARNAGRQAKSLRVIFRIRLRAVVESLLGVGCEGDVDSPTLRSLPLFLHIDNVGDLPHSLAAEIGLAGIDAKQRIFRQTRRGSGRWTVAAATASPSPLSLRSAARGLPLRCFLRCAGHRHQRQNGKYGRRTEHLTQHRTRHMNSHDKRPPEIKRMCRSYWLGPPSSAEPANTFRPSARVTVRALARLEPSLAEYPFTVTLSPVFKEP